MITAHRLLSVALPCLALLAPHAALAQGASSTAPWQAGAGAGFETYSFGDPDAIGIKSLTLMSVPLAARVRLFGQSSVTVSGTYATGSMVRADGTETSISGPTDTYLSLEVPVVRDLLSVSAIVALPTGISALTLEQAEAAGAFAADLLPFRVSSWGSGGAAGFSTSLTRSVGGFGVGIGAGFSAAQEFEPLSEDQRAYRPGNEASLRFVLDRNFGGAGKASLQMSAQRYADDQLEGKNLYRSGDRFSAVGSYSFAAGYRSSGVIYGGTMRRTEGTFLDGSQDNPPAQNLILAGAGMRRPLGRGVISPSVDARVFRSADGVGQGYVGGVGASMEMPAGAVRLVPSVRGRFGRVVARQGSESPLSGVDLGLAVRFGGAR